MRGGLHIPDRTDLRVVPWQLEVGQLLEEHHLCAWSESPRRRERFVIDLGTCLAGFDDTFVCTLDGARMTNVTTLCAEFERALDVGPIASAIDGAGGLVEALRRRSYVPGAAPSKRRYIIWREAHALLARDPKLFGRAADALEGVAAEHEFCGDDVLLIQRAVYVGRPALDMYAEDTRGQFRRWHTERGEMPLWRIVTGRAAPKVARWRIGPELGAA